LLGLDLLSALLAFTRRDSQRVRAEPVASEAFIDGELELLDRLVRLRQEREGGLRSKRLR
jgi:hypothetical protein